MACLSQWDPGGCGCGGCNVTIHAKCGGAAIPGVAVAVDNGGGGTVTGTTDGAGNVTLDISGIGGPATYKVTLTTITYGTITYAAQALLCGVTYNLNACTGCILSCGSPVPAVVRLQGGPCGTYSLTYSPTSSTWLGSACPGCNQQAEWSCNVLGGSIVFRNCAGGFPASIASTSVSCAPSLRVNFSLGYFITL